jgi:DNA polymerase-1
MSTTADQALHEHDPARTLYLVDISSFIFRAFYAIRHLTGPTGEPVNAVYGVATMLQRLIDEAKPRHLAIAFDSKEPSFRKERYAEYKANRAAPPEELIPQFDRIEQLIRSLKMHSYRKSGVEADDLIGTLARRWCDLSARHEVVIVSGDKDLMQLVDGRVQMLDTLKNVVYNPAEVEAKMGVGPALVRDYLALVGDSSDNIPGVSGIGPKGAVELLQEHGSLDGVLAAAAAGKISGKKGATLQAEREMALLSRELATVQTDVGLEVREADFDFSFEVHPECVELLKELGFHSLLEKWNARPQGPAAAPVAAPVSANKPAGRFTTVLDLKLLDDLVSRIRRQGEFAFDLETTSLNPREAEWVGFAIALDEEGGYYIPVGHRGTAVEQLELAAVLERLRPVIEDPRIKKIGQNLKYDWSVCRARGLRPDGIGADTMVAAHLLSPEGRHDLKTLAESHLGYSMLTYEEVCGKGKDQIGFDQVPVDLATRYSAEDAWVAWKLWKKLKAGLDAEHLVKVFASVDLPLVQVLSRMEMNGVCIDEPYLKRLSQEFDQELKGLEKKIAAYTDGPVNLNSPKQLAVLLFEKLGLPVQGRTKTGYSTDASVLEALAPLHEVPRLLLEYREISKLKGTYVDPLPLMRDRTTGRIHASFHQAGTATGRLSSSDPNLQNIPIRSERGLRIRGAFVPSPGNRLISADYSQIELRLLAHMSGDRELVRSFRADEDVHRRTASEIFSVPPEQVDDRMRSIAKAINFGLMYGKTPFGLAQELRISRKEASETIDRYFERYSGVKRFLDRQIAGAREDGFVTTLLGRKRQLPDIHSRNPAMRAVAERMAMNTPIQGTAADLMKLAMIGIDDWMVESGSLARLIIQVHDEVVIDCPEGEVERVQAKVVELMEHAMDDHVRLDVPLRVNASNGSNWMEL